MKKIYIMIYLSLFICTFQLQAKDFHVSSSDQLKDAFNILSGNRDASDSIYLSAGTYRVSTCITSLRIIANEVNEIKICPEEGLSSDEVILSVVDELTINTGYGGPSENNTKITIHGITIQDAKEYGIKLIAFGKTEIRDCIISNNHEGVHIQRSDVVVKDCLVKDNDRGLCTSYSTVVINGNTLSNNTSVGVNINNCPENSVVAFNIINNNGTAILTGNCDNGLTINSNTIFNNTIAISGSYYLESTLSILFNTICNHQKGGIKLSNISSAVISNNLISENGITSDSNYSYFGGILIETSNVTISNNTITKNKIGYSGGGIKFKNWQGGRIIKIYNNIFWNNWAKDKGNDIYIDTYAYFIGLYNNVYKDLEGPVDELVDNSNKDPLFVDYQNDNYHLSPNSPCINAGDNATPNLLETDLDGNPRINDNIIDIGAYEFTTTEKIPSDQNEDWILTNEEFNAYAEAWRKGETWTSGPDPIPIDYVTRSGYLQKKGETYKNEGGKKPECWKPDDNNTKR
jgi:hypothetical protein